MQCPECQLPLLTVEIRGVELDFCTDGHGHWLDEGEVEALMRSDGPVLALRDSAVPTRRRCPRCRRRMRIHRFKDSIELDLCPRGDGIWFDAGELRELIGRLLEERPPAELADLESLFQSLAAQLGGRS